MKFRCINIDWLEVYCLESPSLPLEPAVFEKAGFEVKVRAYGTPQYRQMFTLYRKNEPFIEVRRLPYSLKEQGGIFEKESTHLRLCNYECYMPDPIQDLRDFLFQFGYTLISISRIDLCQDFQKFDDGKDPGVFLSEYAEGKYFKNHLSKIAPRGVEVVGSDFIGHGCESPYMRAFNSWKWGAPTSAISVKLYNKTAEMYDVKDKPYIRQAWLETELIDENDLTIQSEIRDTRYFITSLNRNLNKYGQQKRVELKAKLTEYQAKLKDLKAREKQIWRLEFSLKSDVKGFISGDPNDIDSRGNRRIYPLLLSTIENRSKCLYLFHTLANRYFEFRELAFTRNGTRQRKDRCPLYRPIVYSKDMQDYKPTRITNMPQPSRMDRIIINKLRRILDDNNENPHLDANQASAILSVIEYFRQIYRFDELDKVSNQAIMYIESDPLRDSAEKEHILSEIMQMINRLETLNLKYNV